MNKNIESLKRVEIAIKEFKSGNMVIMMDDESRENEGDLVYPAIFSTPELVNFMAIKARGLICTPLTKEIADELKLSPMVDNNISNYETAFTISVDSKTAKTGISAYERDDCISKLAQVQSSHKDFVKPGHIFPLISKDGGVLMRAGHTEGSIDLCKLAGLRPVSVICEIIKDDGNMARKDDLEKFSIKYKIPIIYISDIIKYRLLNDKLIEKIESIHAICFNENIKIIKYKDHLNRKHQVFQFSKNINKVSNVKFHNIGLDIDLFINNSRNNFLIKSIEYLKKNGGIIIFLETEYSSKDAGKELGIGAQILKDLNITDIKLLTYNKNIDFSTFKRI